MSEIKLNTCPICGCFSRFEYGGAMDSGKRIVKVRCDIGCVEQIIFYCEEADAAKAWNFRASSPEFRDMLEALKSIRRYGLDTLSGRADGGIDDREWQREAVNEMTKRARVAIEEATGCQP